MKAPFVLIGAALLLAANHVAGQAVIIRERAKELRDQNNVRQGVTPPTRAAAPTAANASGTPAPTPALASFQTDLAAVKLDSSVTATVTQKLAADLMTGAQGAKPSLTALTKLAEDLAAANSTKPLPIESRARLAQELDAILNPAKYPQAKPDGIFTDVQAIFQANGLTRTKAVAIAEDVKAVSAEIQRGGAK